MRHSKPYRILQMPTDPLFDIYNTSFTKAISPRQEQYLWPGYTLIPQASFTLVYVVSLCHCFVDAKAVKVKFLCQVDGITSLLHGVPHMSKDYEILGCHMLNFIKKNSYS